MCSSTVYACVATLRRADARVPLRQRHGERTDVAGQRSASAAAPEQRLVERLAHPLGREPGDPRRLVAHQPERHRLGTSPSRERRATPRRIRSGSSWNAVG